VNTKWSFLSSSRKGIGEVKKEALSFYVLFDVSSSQDHRFALFFNTCCNRHTVTGAKNFRLGVKVL
jgi:hypothetical protein